MKKIYMLLIAFLAFGSIGYSQCTVNNADTVAGIFPPDSLFPEITKGQAVVDSYIVQLFVPDTIHYQIYTIVINWLVIDTITGFPTNITYGRNPVGDTIYGGGRQCIYLMGTTTDTPGTYPLKFSGHVNAVVPLYGDTTVSLDTLEMLAGTLHLPGVPNFAYTVREKAAAGINDNNNHLESAMHIVPNPNDGVFDLKTNYGGNMEGDLKVVDITGKVVFAQKLSSNGFYNTTIDLRSFAKGLYTIQIVTADAVGTKMVSVE
jgi:hypothetical protein